MALVDRYTFRIVRCELQYLDPVSGDWRRLMRCANESELREAFEMNWRDIRYDDETETSGSFMAFS